jgi:hypothetical protein
MKKKKIFFDAYVGCVCKRRYLEGTRHGSVCVLLPKVHRKEYVFCVEIHIG